MRTLVVNADDFGLSDGVNAGVVRAHRYGIVTSASLMVHQPAARAAVEAARDQPRLSLGLHIDLAEWQHCGGEWRRVYAWTDESDPAAVARESARQIELFRKLVGRLPSHLDSHQHVHREEPLRSILSRTARDLRVPLRHHSAVRYCGGFYGQGRSGEPMPEAITASALAALILELPDGVTELGCHPAERVESSWAYGVERTMELEALCQPSVRRAIADANVRLASFLEL
ncbi:MAG: ChbG/HpnK family deacetylase [Chloroflexota bacterium]|nr:ChbG/HpnK family deacetylase [Chloroflexota bacterium]